MLLSGAGMRLPKQENRPPIEGRRAAAASGAPPTRRGAWPRAGSGSRPLLGMRSAEEPRGRSARRAATSPRPAASRSSPWRRRDQPRRLAVRRLSRRGGRRARVQPASATRAGAADRARLPSDRRTAIWVLAIAARLVLVLAPAVARNWRLARLLIFLGAAVVAISLAVDAPKGLREGTARDRVSGGEGDAARAASGSSCSRGVTLIVAGPLLALELRAQRDAERDAAGGQRAGAGSGALRGLGLARGARRGHERRRRPAPPAGAASSACCPFACVVSAVILGVSERMTTFQLVAGAQGTARRCATSRRRTAITTRSPCSRRSRSWP